MNTIVCLKQVPSRESVLKVRADQSWIEERDLGWEINEPDVYALEEALRLKEAHGGDVIICSVGPSRVQQAIREAFAKGADQGIHLDDPLFERLDAYHAALVMAEAIKKSNIQFDLILTGLQSDDFGYAQTGVILAELLGLPHVTIVMQIQVLDGRIKVKRELEAGWFQWIELPLPAVLTIQSGINHPRYATLKGIMGAKKKPIQTMSAHDLGLSHIGNFQRFERVYIPQKTKRTEMIEGSAKEAVAKLVEKLQREAKVI
ncbi:MAG: electron transfer flavoprotein subunit beta/FixA family protein [Acidobacteriota bacterium]|nr:electron transfer flavoprotein subunit beta/FixA family protein [Blastocatellia bacterium]MDW8238494.1 electron transfer flavoprotein subunit beta/FixA family protein [Acidobacteriota bacterium]